MSEYKRINKNYSTFNDRHLESDHSLDISPTPTIVPVNLTKQIT